MAAQIIETFQRIDHKPTELAGAQNGAYDPQMNVLRAREGDVKLELQIFRGALQRTPS